MHCLIEFKDLNKSTEVPELFTNPFYYSPHPLCIQAAKQIQSRLPLPNLNNKGKMYGVMVVKQANDKIGFLAAYSGNEQTGSIQIPFVPQVFDITNPNGFFRKGEAELDSINLSISVAEKSPVLKELQKELEQAERNEKNMIKDAKEAVKLARKKRKVLRQEAINHPDKDQIFDQLIKESQTEKSQFNKLKKKLKQQIEEKQQQLDSYLEQINLLKQKRKNQSAQLQKKLFDHYIFTNALGEQKSASDIFSQTAFRTPPAGTGDCCAPKLMNYAYLHQLTPLAMAEFWWGPSPKKEIRQHGHFYPACKSKCEPILGHMLKGLKIEKQKNQDLQLNIELIYEDDAIAIINKPSGLLSVPGKEEKDSVYSQIKTLYPKASGPLVVHRLDMATSGIMVIAKTKEAHEHLQKQFLNKTIKKRYVAWLEGTVTKKKGSIDLPLRVDLDDRPRQLVCFDYGKQAITKWELIERTINRTKVHFYPLTGRTHQLRLHAAHPLGLNTPIVGDELYGEKANRLMLHAEEISFIHPTSLEIMSFQTPASF